MTARLTPARTLVALVALGVVALWATDSVIIESGDTLSELADRHDVSVAELTAWNDLEDPDLILAGAPLRLTAPAVVEIPDGYTVHAGDTLSAIARAFGLSVADIAARNQLADPDLIIAGQQLDLIPPAAPGDAADSSTTSSTSTTTTLPAADDEGAVATDQVYEIQPGDTLSGIARDHGISTADLIVANSLTDADRIVAGRTLVIPGSDEPSDPPPDTPTTTTTTAAPATTAPPATTTAPPTTTVAPSTPAAPAPGPATATGLSGYFERWSTAYGVPRTLVEAVAWKESSWRPDAVGPSGHLGIGQMSPDTVAFVEERLLGLDLEPLDASNGIQLMSRYLRYLLDRTDDEREALAAYNQGLNSVRADGVSSSGGAYADDVLAIRDQRS